MTKTGLCAFLGIARSTWRAWKRNRPDLLPTIEHAEDIVWIWQFNGAAAGLLDEWTVIRQLGIGGKAQS